VPPRADDNDVFDTVIVPAQEALPAHTRLAPPELTGGSRLKQTAEQSSDDECAETGAALSAVQAVLEQWRECANRHCCVDVDRAARDRAAVPCPCQMVRASSVNAVATRRVRASMPSS
jgi:hypothetical protein